MWAGLLAGSATSDGRDESNLMFTDLLSKLTSAQVKILNYACEKAEKFCSKSGLVAAEALSVPLEEITTIAGISELHRLDRELDHLRSLGLLTERGGIPMPHHHAAQQLEQTHANLQPSSIGLPVLRDLQEWI